MKRVLVILISLFILCGCAPEKIMQNEGISIVCASFPPYDFARNIAGDKASVRLLVPPGSESHSYDPKPADIIATADADIFIYGGGESDEWVRKLLEAAEKKPETIIEMTALVPIYTEELKEGMQGEHGGEIDEHVWTSPVNAQKICEGISDKLCAIDALNTQYYNDRLTEYEKRLQELDASFRKAVSDGGKKTIVFGDRFPFRYLAEEYGLDYYAAFPGCSQMSEPSAKTVAFLIEKVKTEQIPVVFCIEFSNRKICDTISEATGAKVMLLHSCHNLTKQEFDSGLGYIELMHKNAEAIREALDSGAN